MGNWPLRTYPIPQRSWHWAQQSPAIRSRIGQAVVVESAIEFWDRQHTIQHCNLINKSREGEELIPLGSRRCGQQPPAIRSRIGQVVIELSAIKCSITLVKSTLSEGLADSWVLMRQTRTLYRRVAGLTANNLPQSDPESAQRLWRNLTSGSGIARVPIKTTPTRVSDFMGFDATETSFIPLRSWRQDKQPPAIGSRIGQAVVEESAIEIWDRQHPILFSPVTS